MRLNLIQKIRSSVTAVVVAIVVVAMVMMMRIVSLELKNCTGLISGKINVQQTIRNILECESMSFPCACATIAKIDHIS
jgi:hypothetical protein